MLTTTDSESNEQPDHRTIVSSPGSGSASAIVRTFIALLGNTGLQGLLGFVFFAVASRHAGDAAIKRNFTIIAFIRSAAPLMQAGLMDSALRRLPTIARPGRFVLRLYGVVAVSAFVLGVAYLVFGRELFTFIAPDAPSWVPVLVVAGAATWGIVIVQDVALVALDRSHIVPLESLVFGVFGIVLALSAGIGDHPFALLVVYLAPLPLLVVLGNAVLVRRLRTWQPFIGSANFTRGAEVRTWMADLLMMAMISAQRGLIPAIVASRVSDASAAVFIAVYALTLAAHEGLAAITTAFVARASRDPSHTVRPVITSLQLIVGVGIPMCVVVFVAAGPLLSIFADRYSDGAQFLRLMMVGAPFAAISSVATLQARLRRQPLIAVAILAVHTLFVFGGALWIVPRHGIDGFGYATFAGEALVGLIGLSYLNRTVLQAERRTDETLSRSPAVPVEARPRPVPLTYPAAFATVLALVVSVAAVVTAAADIVAPSVAVAQMAAMLVWPGFWLRRSIGHTSAAFQCSVVLGVSVSAWLVLSEVLLLVEWWQPRLLYVSLIGGPALSTLVGIVRRNDFAAIVRAARPVTKDLRPSTARERVAGVLLFAIAIVGLFVTAVTIDRTRATAIGLASAFGPMYWIGLVSASALFVAATFRERVARKTAFASIVVVTGYYHAVMPFATRLPRFFWTTRHTAVVDFITQNGFVDRRIDIYHNWPAFFSASGVFSDVSRADPLYYARWSHLVIMLACVVSVFALTEAFTHDQRLQLTATFLFVAGQWTGQEYFSPQAVAMLLLLVMLTVLLRTLSSYRDSGPLGMLRRRVLEPLSRSATLRPDWAYRLTKRTSFRDTRVGLAIAALAFVAMALAHQLTPYVALLMVTTLVMLRRVRAFWLLPIAYLALVGTLALAYSFLERSGINLLSFDLNPAAKRGGGALFYDLEEHGGGLIVGRLTTLLVVTFMVGAVVGLFRRIRSGFSELEPALIVACPPFVVLFQGYDGEGLYRAFLYALPGTSYLLACALLPRLNAFRLVRTRIAAPLLCIGLAVLWPFVGFGREKTYGFFDDEVAAAELIETYAPQGSSIVGFSTGLPVRVTARYGAVNGQGLPPLLLLPEVRNAPSTDAQLTAVTDLMRQLDPNVGGEIYVVWSRSQANSADHFRLASSEQIGALVNAVAQSPDFEFVRRWDDAVVFRWRSAV